MLKTGIAQWVEWQCWELVDQDSIPGRALSLRHHMQTGSGTRSVSYSVGTWDCFHADKAAGVWNWPLTSVWEGGYCILVFWLWGWDWRLTELRPLLLAYCSSPDGWMKKWVKELFFLTFGGPRWNDIYRGKPKDSEENLSQCHFAHYKSHWIDLAANPGHRGEGPANNRLSHCTANWEGG
jgi:hypothetical protein